MSARCWSDDGSGCTATAIRGSSPTSPRSHSATAVICTGRSRPRRCITERQRAYAAVPGEPQRPGKARRRPPRGSRQLSPTASHSSRAADALHRMILGLLQAASAAGALICGTKTGTQPHANAELPARQRIDPFPGLLLCRSPWNGTPDRISNVSESNPPEMRHETPTRPKCLAGPTSQPSPDRRFGQGAAGSAWSRSVASSCNYCSLS